MSHSQNLNYKCPYCGEEFEIEIWNTVNAEEDPDLRDRCKSGDIFQHSCPHCHKDFMIQNNLLYEDPENRFVLFVSSKDFGDTLKSYGEPLVKKGYRLRRVSTIQEFTEKIQIFEDGANDIEVELAKYDSFIEFLSNRKGNAQDVTSIEYQYQKDGIMKINLRMDDKGMSFIIPEDGLKDEIDQEPDLYKIDEASFPCVNGKWIISLFDTEGESQLKS